MLTLESRDTFGIAGERFRQEFDGDIASELRIGGLINVAHAARSKVARNLEMRQPAADHCFGESWPGMLPNFCRSVASALSSMSNHALTFYAAGFLLSVNRIR